MYTLVTLRLQFYISEVLHIFSTLLPFAFVNTYVLHLVCVIVLHFCVRSHNLTVFAYMLGTAAVTLLWHLKVLSTQIEGACLFHKDEISACTRVLVEG